MIWTILSTFLGAAIRLAPEILKFLDKKADRAHELAMFNAQLEADKIRFQAQQQLEETKGDNAFGLAQMQAMIEALKGQGQMLPGDSRWALLWNGINISVRPVLTYWWCVVLYTGSMVAEYHLLTHVQGLPGYQAILLVFGDPEKNIAASMISFWFIDRTLHRMRGGK